MYDKDPVLARPSAHLEEWFAGETAVPLPQCIDAETDRWIERRVSWKLDQETRIHVPTLRCEVQEQINPLRAPTAAGYRRVVNETAEPASIRSRRLGNKRTLAAIPCFNEEVAIGSVVLMARLHVVPSLETKDHFYRRAFRDSRPRCRVLLYRNTAPRHRDAEPTIREHG